MKRDSTPDARVSRRGGVLFLCTANACRSQMAEGFARRLLPPDVRVFSAGTRPKSVDPRAARVMSELGVDISTQRSKSLEEIPLGAIDHVVTLCGEAAEQCPVIPERRYEHWAVPDPARTEGWTDDAFNTFRAARDEILRGVERLAASLQAEPAIGVIGGSGFYDLPGLSQIEDIEVETPFVGAPSAVLVTGRLRDGGTSAKETAE